MAGFQIWYEDEMIHEETGFDVDSTQDMYDNVVEWWNDNCDDGMYSEEVLVKLFCDYEEEELTMDELL